MTYDFKAVLDSMPLFNDHEVISRLDYVDKWFGEHADEIKEALTLAAEHERVKKERDELAAEVKLYRSGMLPVKRRCSCKPSLNGE